MTRAEQARSPSHCPKLDRFRLREVLRGEHRSATVWCILSEVTDLPSVMVLNVRGLVHMWSIWAVLRLASTNGQTAKRPNGQTAKRPRSRSLAVAVRLLRLGRVRSAAAAKGEAAKLERRPRAV